MPKINTPEVSKGFWLTLGALAALFLVALATSLYQRAREHG